MSNFNFQLYGSMNLSLGTTDLVQIITQAMDPINRNPK